jgi:hypothetical protein
MEAKNKRNIVLLSVLAGTVVFVLIRRKVNSNQAKALLDFVNKMPSQTDLSTNVDRGIESTMATKPDWNKLKIGTLVGPASDPKIKDAMAKVVVGLYSAISGIGTSKSFFTELSKIKNKTTLAAVNQLYTLQNKESLFTAMKGESALNNVYFAAFSDKTKNSLYIPGFSDAKWSPILSEFFNRLPIN